MLHSVANLPLKTPPNKQNPPRSLGVNSQLLYIVLNPSCVYLEHLYSFMDYSLMFNSMFLQTVVISCLSWLKLCVLMSGHMCLCPTVLVQDITEKMSFHPYVSLSLVPGKDFFLVS